MKRDKITFFDLGDYRLLDLRPDGVTCIAAIGRSDFANVRNGPELHCHPHAVEICLCLKGNLSFETDVGDYKFLPGTIFVSTPDQPHRLKNNPKGLKLYRVLFAIPRPGDTFLGLDKRESEWLSRSLQNLPKRIFQSTPSVRSAFDRIFDIYDNLRPSPSRRAHMKSAVLDLLISIVDAARRMPGKPPGDIISLANRIRENPESDFSADGAANEIGLSRSAFSELFKRSMGLPLHAYVIDCRIRKAKSLLENSDRPTASIAAELNFVSMPHFIKTFKRVIGLTPFALRRLSKPKDAASVRSCGRDALVASTGSAATSTR